MTEASGQRLSSQPPAPAPTPTATTATVADVMRPPLTTVEQNDHAAAAAYLMRHAGATALVVLDERTSRPIGLVTEADIVNAVAAGKDVNDVRVRELMTTELTVVSAMTSIRLAAESMTAGRFRHLPVVDDARLVGMVDIRDVCSALLNPPAG